MSKLQDKLSQIDRADREARISVRAKMYAEGSISLREFYEKELAEGDDIREIIYQAREDNRQKLKEMVEEAKQARLQREGLSPKPETDPPVFDMTKDEFNALSLYEQTKLYEEHPDEIRKLLEPVKETKLTREEFQKMSLSDQSKYFEAKPEEIRSLLEGTVDFVDVEDII